MSGEVEEGQRFFGHSVMRPSNYQPQMIQSTILSAMEAVLRKPEGKAVLVIGDARELVYSLAEVTARGDRPIQVFYLKNGVLAYHNWKQGGDEIDRPDFQTISLTSSSSRLPAPGSPYSHLTKAKSGCSVCPKKR